MKNENDVGCEENKEFRVVYRRKVKESIFEQNNNDDNNLIRIEIPMANDLLLKEVKIDDDYVSIMTEVEFSDAIS